MNMLHLEQKFQSQEEHRLANQIFKNFIDHNSYLLHHIRNMLRRSKD